jgi:hypothetical protein
MITGLQCYLYLEMRLICRLIVCPAVTPPNGSVPLISGENPQAVHQELLLVDYYVTAFLEQKPHSKYYSTLTITKELLR